VLFAFYQSHGDPLAAQQITKADQILPYFVVHELPRGLPGLLIAAIFAASMSTVSAGVNSLTSATICDFYQTLAPPASLPERRLLRLARGCTLLYGALVTALAFAVSVMRGNLVESVNGVIALVGGPLLGLFLLGIFARRVTTRGALCGALAGFLLVLVLFIQSQRDRPVVSFLWITLIGCSVTMLVGLAVNALWREQRNSISAP
jgi:sodium-coupled monocarboxylate transporter 8/12